MPFSPLGGKFPESRARRITTARQGKTGVTYTKEQENHGNEDKGNERS